MPGNYLRQLTAFERTQRANQHLARYLAFVAGAVNAGGFLAVHQYTSHMSGIVSAMADDVVLGNLALVADGLGALLSFVAGAATCAVLVNWSRRRHLASAYAMPLVLEAALLIVFGLLGPALQVHTLALMPLTVGVLCFVMGLQNAMVTKVSNAEIRTTHVTGMVTDIGIELGKLFYVNRMRDDAAPVLANRGKLALLGGLVLLFFCGGVAGAVGFKWIGYMATVPLAGLLLLLAVLPVIDDLRHRLGNAPGAPR